MAIAIVANRIGLVMCVVPSALASFAYAYLPRGNDDIWTLVGAWSAVAFVWDVLYRIFNRDEHWLSSRRGGHIFFVPVCILAGCAFCWYANHAMKAGYWFPRTTPNPNGIFP